MWQIHRKRLPADADVPCPSSAAAASGSASGSASGPASGPASKPASGPATEPAGAAPHGPGAWLLLLLVALLPAWISVGALALEARQREAALRDREVLGSAQALRQQLESASPTPRSPQAGEAWPDRLAGVPVRAGWTAGVQDGRGGVLAATPGFDRLLGGRLDAALAAGGASDTGLAHLRSAAGVPVVLAYSRMTDGDAFAVVGVSESTLLADWHRRFEPLLAAIALLLTAAAGTAVWLVRRWVMAARRLARAAGAHAEAVRLLHARTRERDDALRAQARAVREAQQDPLTRLANRTVFVQRLQGCIQARGAAGGELSVLFIDLDDFKAVNDRWGHAIGDALLCAFATRLRAGIREIDLPARLAGDEFAVLIDGLTAAEAEPVAQQLLDRLSQPYRIGGFDIRMSASIGMATYPRDGNDASRLLQAADAAMYTAKAAGKGDYRRSNWGTQPLLRTGASTP